MRIARADSTVAKVGEVRIARPDSTVAKVGEMRIARPDGTIIHAYTSLPPAMLLDTTLITSAGTHTITPPAGTGFIAAFLVGGGGGGGKSSSPLDTGQGGARGEYRMVFQDVTPGNRALTIGAGGSGSTAQMGGGAGSLGGSTSFLGTSAPGGAGGAASGGTVAGGEASGNFAADFLPFTEGISAYTIGPSGKTDGQAGQRGGGGAGGTFDFTGGGAGGAGGDGWARIWFWTRDPRA